MKKYPEEEKREIAICFIMTAQAMEGIETTREQAEAAYNKVQIEKRIQQ